MKKAIFTIIMSAVVYVATADEIMRRSGDTCIVNTTTLCDTKGFKGTTPLEVYILDGKVVRIESLQNMESKGYYRRVEKEVFPKYLLLKVSKAKKLSSNPEIDGFSGATYSTKAVQSNINAALRYYDANKK